jgi:hypothetical protein
MTQNGKSIQNQSYDGYPIQIVELPLLGNAVCFGKDDIKI